MFEGKTVLELGAIINEANEELDTMIKKARKIRKRIANAEKTKAGIKLRENLKDAEKGDLVNVMFGGEEISAIFVSLTDKDFTVNIGGELHTLTLDKLVSIEVQDIFTFKLY